MALVLEATPFELYANHQRYRSHSLQLHCNDLVSVVDAIAHKRLDTVLIPKIAPKMHRLLYSLFATSLDDVLLLKRKSPINFNFIEYFWNLLFSFFFFVQ